MLTKETTIDDEKDKLEEPSQPPVILQSMSPSQYSTSNSESTEIPENVESHETVPKVTITQTSQEKTTLDDRSIWTLFNTESNELSKNINEKCVNEKEEMSDTNEEDHVSDERDHILEDDIDLELKVHEDDSNQVDTPGTKHKDLKFIDFLKTKHGTGLKTELGNKATDHHESQAEKGQSARILTQPEQVEPRTEHTDPEHDAELVELAKWTISFMDNVEERRSNCVRDENRQYQCSLCGYQNLQRYRYVQHLDRHVEALSQRMVTCDQCDLQLPEKFIPVHQQIHKTHPALPGTIQRVERSLLYDLLYFLVQDYPKLRGHGYNCRYCDEAFTNIDHYRSHFIVQHSLKYMCTQCGKPLYSYLQIYQHIEQHKVRALYDQSEASTVAPATEANGELSKQAKVGGRDGAIGGKNEVVDEHGKDGLDGVGQDGEEQNDVGQSDVVLGNKGGGHDEQVKEEDRKADMETPQKNKKGKILCNICHKAFHRICTLKEHIEFMHEGREPIKCKQCPAKFRSMDSYRRHTKTHEVKDAKFVCATCGARFKAVHQLHSHKRKHDRSVYLCSTCNASFCKKDSLEIHLVENDHFSFQQPESSIKYKTCSVCGKQLANANHLFKHMDRMHGKAKTCPFCQKSFNYHANMVAHMKSHSKHNPKCSHCDLWFRNKTELLKHINELHIGVSPVAPPSREKRQPVTKASPRDKRNYKREADKALRGLANSEQLAKRVPHSKTNSRQISKTAWKNIKPVTKAFLRVRAKRKLVADEAKRDITNSELVSTPGLQGEENSRQESKMIPAGKSDTTLTAAITDNQDLVTAAVPQSRGSSKRVSRVVTQVRSKTQQAADEAVAGVADSKQKETTVPQDRKVNSKLTTEAAKQASSNTKEVDDDDAQQDRAKSKQVSKRHIQGEAKSERLPTEGSGSVAKTKLGSVTDRSPSRVEIEVMNPTDNMDLLAEVAMGNLQASPVPQTQDHNVTEIVMPHAQAVDNMATHIITVQADVHKEPDRGTTQVKPVLDTIVEAEELEEHIEVDNVICKAEANTTARKVDLNSVISKAYDDKVRADAEKLEQVGNDEELLLSQSDLDYESDGDASNLVMDTVDELQEMETDSDYVYTL